MPKAVADVKVSERHELKSCPEGYVELRRLTYGEILQRRGMTSMKFQSGGKGKDFQGEMELATAQITLFEFSRCIVDHNLEHADGRKLNLANQVEIQQLDPKIGTEIDVLISGMNNFEEEEADFSTGSA